MADTFFVVYPAQGKLSELPPRMRTPGLQFQCLCGYRAKMRTEQALDATIHDHAEYVLVQIGRGEPMRCMGEQ